MRLIGEYPKQLLFPHVLDREKLAVLVFPL